MIARILNALATSAGQRLGFALLAAALLAPSTARAELKLPPKAIAAMREGTQAARNQEWSIALQQFQNAYQQAPASSQVVFDLGLVNDKMGGHEFAALAWYRAYLALAPAAANRKAVVNRVTALEAVVKASAKSLADKALAVNERLPIGDRFGELEAVAGAKAALGDSAGALAFVAHASTADLQSYTGALSPQQQASAAAENRDSAYANLAGDLAKANDLGAAETALRRIVGANPYEHDRQSGLQNIANALINAKHFRKAASYAALVHGPSRVSIFQNLANSKMQAGDKAGAKISIDKAIAAIGQVNPTQYDLNNLRSSLIQSVGTIEGVVAARRLYAQIRWTRKDDANTRDSAAENLVTVLISAGRLAEARSLVAAMRGPREWLTLSAINMRLPSARWYAVRALASAVSARQTAATNALGLRLDKARAPHEVDVVEAALAKQPQTAATNAIALKVASAYQGFGQLAKAKRVLDVQAAQLARTRLSTDRASSQINLAQAYVRLGQTVEAARIVSRLVVAPLLPALLKQPGQYSANGLLQNLGELAAAQAAAGDLRGARTSALKALAFGGRLANEYSVLNAVCPVAPVLGLAEKCAALIARTPPAVNRVYLYESLVSGYTQAIKTSGSANAALAARIKAMAAKIGDATGRMAALRPVVGAEIRIGDWRAALALAEGVPSLVEDIASQMIAAGQIKQAAALEPQMTSDPRSFNFYANALSNHLAEGGDVAGALAAAARLRDPSWRALVFYEVAKSAFDWGGPGAGLAATAATKEFNRYFARPDFKCIDLPQVTPTEPQWSPARVPPDQKKCLSLRADWMMSNTQWRCCQAEGDMPASLRFAWAERRYWLDRDWLAAENSSNQYTLQAAKIGEVEPLYGFGAIELANSQFMPGDADPTTAVSNAVQPMLAEDNPGVARTHAELLVAKAKAVAPGYKKDIATLNAVQALAAVGDFDAASALASQIADREEYLSAVRALSVEAQAKHLPSAAALISQEAQLDIVQNQTYYLYTILPAAAELGLHPLAETILAQYIAAEPSEWCSTDQSYADGLLRHGDRDIAIGKLKTDLARLASTAPVPSSTCAFGLAKLLAWAGEDDGLQALLKSAPDAAFTADALKAAAQGYARAGEPDKAQEALRKALAALKIERPDFDAWSAALIAEAQGTVDPAGAAKAAQAIADAGWRARAIAALASQRFAASDPQGAASLLQGASAAPVLDQMFARAARYLFGQGMNEQGRALIAKISEPTLREATWRFVVLSRARLQPSADPFKDLNAVKTPGAKAYLLIDLSALLQNQKRFGLAKKALAMAQSAEARIADPLVRADVAAWIARSAVSFNPNLVQTVRNDALALAAALPDPAAKAAMQKLANDQKAPEQANAAALAARTSNEADQFVLGLGYSPGVQGGVDAYARSLASKAPQVIVQLLISAAEARVEQLSRLRALSQGWKASAAGNPKTL